MVPELIFWILLPQFCKPHYERWRNFVQQWIENKLLYSR